MSALSFRLPESFHKRLAYLAVREGTPSISSSRQPSRRRWLLWIPMRFSQRARRAAPAHASLQRLEGS